MQLDKKPQFLGLLLLGVACSCTAPSKLSPSPQKEVLAQPSAEISRPKLTIQNWPHNEAPQARVYVLTIPPNEAVEVAISDGLKTVEEFAADTEAMAVLNGGFFDPNNGQTTSFMTVNGELVADPRNNRRLIDNPDLSVYMEQILNRSEFRRYACGGDIRYDIAFHNADAPNGCTIHSSLGAGPQLIPDTSQVEGFTDYADGALMRDAIGTQQRNARSAIGLQENGTLLWVMVAQTGPTGGMTLAELTEFMITLGAEKALNLDGGSSSSLYVAESFTARGVAQSYYGRLDQQGQKIQRPIKSVLIIPSSVDH